MTPAGYRALLGWLRGHGELGRVGVEGTGAYGAALARHLRAEGVTVMEVNRPDRQTRAAVGKSDPLDAYAAARAALAGTAAGVPKTRDGAVEAIRALRVARRSAVKARTQATNQLKALLLTGPADLREKLRHLNTRGLGRSIVMIDIMPTGPDDHAASSRLHRPAVSLPRTGVEITASKTESLAGARRSCSTRNTPAVG